jgi:cytochrome b involved in lipid metabolism
VRAAFTKTGQKKAFRAQFKDGDKLSVQYLIVDKKPENKLKSSALPSLVITSPAGSSMTLKFTERTKFYEPYGKVNYLYLARYSATADTGIYNFTITSKGKAAITVAVGDREVRGDVVRGAAPAPSQSAAQTPEPSQSPTKTQTANANNSASNCWSIIDRNVYNLTAWIDRHPGGDDKILSLCGKDGTSAFKSQHAGRAGPVGQLDSYKIGKLKD